MILEAYFKSFELEAAVVACRSTMLKCFRDAWFCAAWELYTDTISCVRVDGHNSEWFPILSGVRQGCTVAPDLFLVPMDWLMEHTSHHGMIGTTIGMEEPFTDLDFAGDVALLV